MRITRTIAGAVGLLLTLVAVTAAAATADKVYSGNLTFNNGYRHTSFAMKATFTAGKLTRLYGTGNEFPYKKNLSNAASCGAANIYDTADQADKGKYKSVIKGSVKKSGAFHYVIPGAFHDTVTLSGTLTAKTLKGTIRFYQSHLFGKRSGKSAHCDTGVLPLTLSR